jgi:hypothetical protein
MGGKAQTGRPFMIRIAYSLTPYYGGTNGARAVIGLGFQETARLRLVQGAVRCSRRQ